VARAGIAEHRIQEGADGRFVRVLDARLSGVETQQLPDPLQAAVMYRSAKLGKDHALFAME
jgi:hypothetical protein